MKYAVYCDKDAAPWQGMIVGRRYEILKIDTPVGGVPWYKTYMGNGSTKTRWASSCCFEKIEEGPPLWVSSEEKNDEI